MRSRPPTTNNFEGMNVSHTCLRALMPPAQWVQKGALLQHPLLECEST